MKTKIVSLLLALGLTTNAAFSGNSAKVGYASDFFYRGVQKAEQSVQSSVKLGSALGGVDLSAHACTNQSVDTGVDSYNLGAGVGKSFSDGLLSVYAGVNHFEDRPGDALSEFQVRVSSNVALNPSVSVYRDFDESLYTVELGVGHSFDLSIASLDLSAAVGNTDLTNSTDRTYYAAGADISKSISENAELSVGVDYVDADDLDEREFVFGTALTVKF
jgi:hypothetical protein